jgi:hypothetical protein
MGNGSACVLPILLTRRFEGAEMRCQRRNFTGQMAVKRMSSEIHHAYRACGKNARWTMLRSPPRDPPQILNLLDCRRRREHN